MNHAWCTSNSIPEAQRLICDYVVANGNALRAKQEGAADAAVAFAEEAVTQSAVAAGLQASDEQIHSMAVSMLQFELFNEWLTTI